MMVKAGRRKQHRALSVSLPWQANTKSNTYPAVFRSHSLFPFTRPVFGGGWLLRGRAAFTEATGFVYRKAFAETNY